MDNTNKQNKMEEINAFLEKAVAKFNSFGDKDAFSRDILYAVKWVGIDKISKITKLSRVEIYDTLDGVGPHIDNLGHILIVLGIKINFDFDRNISQIKNLLD